MELQILNLIIAMLSCFRKSCFWDEEEIFPSLLDWLSKSGGFFHLPLSGWTGQVLTCLCYHNLEGVQYRCTFSKEYLEREWEEHPLMWNGIGAPNTGIQGDNPFPYSLNFHMREQHYGYGSGWDHGKGMGPQAVFS